MRLFGSANESRCTVVSSLEYQVARYKRRRCPATRGSPPRNINNSLWNIPRSYEVRLVDPGINPLTLANVPATRSTTKRAKLIIELRFNDKNISTDSALNARFLSAPAGRKPGIFMYPREILFPRELNDFFPKSLVIFSLSVRTYVFFLPSELSTLSIWFYPTFSSRRLRNSFRFMRVFPANKHEERQRICAASTDKYISDREMLKNFLILFDNRMHAFVKFITGISISLNDEEM